jgi:sugar phosphate isomerase/epimerase
MGKQVDLVASYWTLAGVFPNGPREFSRFDFQDRVKAASAAGFKGLGIWHADLAHILERRTLGDMKRILDDNGMEHVEVEFVTDWFLDGEKKRRSDERRKMLLDAAEVLQAKRVKAGDFNREPCPFDRLVESFADLCADAAQHGTSIAFEPMGAAVIDSLQDSLRMVSESGAKNGGIMLDIWHVVDRVMPWEDLRRIPLRFLMGVELNDATMQGSQIRVDEENPRTFCGEGDFDIKGFIRCMQEGGYAGPWGVEVIGQKLVSMPLQEVAGRSFSTTAAQFDA